jgi:hypothetical protein
MINFIIPALITFLGVLLAYPLAPLAALLSNSKGRAPLFLRWLETHDNLGWSGPLSEGLPATRRGLCQWWWRNKAYTLRNVFRANPTLSEIQFNYVEGIELVPSTGYFYSIIKIGRWWEKEWGYAFKWFKISFKAGWKLRPYLNGHRPYGPTATGIIMPFSIRSDDYDPE